MDWRDFLTFVLPYNGRISVRGVNFNGVDPDESTWIRRFDDFDGIQEFLESIEKSKRESFYSPASFGWDNNCKTTNIAFLRSFYLDLDCGEGERKQFPTQAAGIAALKEFCKAVKLPAPMLVSSGNGVHAYWVLEEDVNLSVWAPYQAGLHQLAEKHGVPSDPATMRGTQPMRLPGTLHFKDPENPKPVVVLKQTTPITLERFSQSVPMGITNSGKRGAPDALTAALAGENGEVPPSKFMKLLSKSRNIIPVKEDVKYVIDGKVVFKKETLEKSAGCPHVLHAYESRETMEYNLWCGILQIAQFCVDRDEAIQVMGEGHQDDDFDKNSAKAATFDKGAATCDYFRKLNPSLCNGCIHNTKINSPYTLGCFIERTETEEDRTIDEQYNDRTDDVRSIKAPKEYPFPWLRPKNGGVAVQGILAAKVDEESSTDEVPEAIVYDRDLWVEGRFHDPEEGDCLHVVHVSGQDGIREFMMPQRMVTKKDTCLDLLSRHGFYAHDRIHLIQKYLNAWVKYYQNQSRALQARPQFGFYNNDTCFVVGDREYRADGTVNYSPPSNATFRLTPHYTPKGSLDEWKKVIQVLEAPGNEARAFVFFAGLGTIFYHWSDVGSPLINLTNTASGVGKTTIQRVVASIWGSPKGCMLNTEDTKNALFQRFGVLQHLPLILDEMTNMDGEELSKFSFQLSQNRAKNRLQAHTNAERQNDSTWSTLCFGSSNSSSHQTLKSFRTSVDGELRRILEIKLEQDHTLGVVEGARLFNTILENNYGWAGDVLIRHVILPENYQKAKLRFLELEEELQNSIGFAHNDRMYKMLCVVAFLGAEIGQQLGLHNIDIQRVRDWVTKLMGVVQVEVKEASSENSVELLGRFINLHSREILVINGKPIENAAVDNLRQGSIKDNMGALSIRYEPDNGSLFIDKGRLERWCADERINQTSMTEGLYALGAVRSRNFVKNLAQGTMSVSAPVRTLWLDTKIMDSLGISLTPEDSIA